jgi:hypothetical protein
VLKEVNAERGLDLPDIPGLIIERRTGAHWEVGMKKEMEEMAL